MISNNCDIAMEDIENEHCGYSPYQRYISFRRTEDEKNPITQAIKEFGMRSSYAESEVNENDFESNGIIVDESVSNKTVPTLFKDFVSNFTHPTERTEYAIQKFYKECLLESKISRQQDYLSSVERKAARKNKKQKATSNCVFCENNREPKALVRSHAVRDSLGRVLCPKLRSYICPICGESGDLAHTIKYCPQKKIYTMEDMHLATKALSQIEKLTEREIPDSPTYF